MSSGTTLPRALSEYAVGGLKTTIPFFQWILHDPDFLEGKMDTTLLDRVLAAREGQPFQEVSSESEEAAVIGAALHTYMRSRASAGESRSREAAPSDWKRAGLLEGLAPRLNVRSDPWYFASLAIGALAGAILFGSANLTLAGLWPVGHSIAGAIAGGVVSVEIYKWTRGIGGSTGLPFVAPLALGIVVGRLGCFFAGMPDYTYGVPATAPWAVDFGDGVHRIRPGWICR